MAVVIDIDELKKSIFGYDPNNAEEFHSESAKLADKEFEKTIKSSEFKEVILLSGGSASGKSEFLDAYLKDKDAIIYDSTLSSIEGVKIKTKLAKKFDKNVTIYAVWPENFEDAFLVFLNRERKFPLEHFLRTHSNSRKVLLEIVKGYPNISICLYTNNYDYDVKLKYKELIFDSREKLIEYLGDNQLTEDTIFEMISNQIDYEN